MLPRNQYYKLSEIIDCLKATGEQGDDFCLYGDDQEQLDLAASYFIADYPEVNNDREIYPGSVQEKGLDYLYSGQQFADVVTLLLEQKPDAVHDDYVKALNYYQENDDFMSF
jgi:hypothetical protein